MLADWLEETGELYFNLYLPNIGATTYFICSLPDLKLLVLRLGMQPITITIFRPLQFSLRGIADQQLLEQALDLIPDNAHYDILYFRYFPEQADPAGFGTGHTELRR